MQGMSKFITRTKFQVLNGAPGEIDQAKVLHHRLYRTVHWRELQNLYYESQRGIWDRSRIPGGHPRWGANGIVLGIRHQMENMVDRQMWADWEAARGQRERTVRAPR